MPDVVFGSKGAAKVLAEQQKLADGARAMTVLCKEENRELARLGRDVARSFKGTLTKVETLKREAARLQQAIANPKLPKIDREMAAKALSGVQDKIKEIGDQGDDTKKRLDQVFGGGAQALFRPFVTAAGGAATAVGLIVKGVTDEIRNVQELANKASSTQMTVAASRDLLIGNSGSLSKEQKAAIGAGKLQAPIVSSTGLSEAIINQAMAAGLSSSAGDLAKTKAAVELGGRVLATRPGEIPDFVGSLLGMSKFTHWNEAIVNQGLVSSIGNQSRVVSKRQQAINIPPALTGAAAFGLVESAPSLFAALSNAAEDDQGSQTKTALIRLAEQIEKYEGGEKKSLAGLSTDQKFMRLLKDPKLGTEFAKTLSLDAQLKGPAVQLFRGGPSVVRRELAKAAREIPRTRDALRARGQQSLDDLNLNTLKRVGDLSRALDSGVERARVNAGKKILTFEEIDQLKELLTRTTGTTSAFQGFRISAARGLDRQLSVDEAAGLLEPAAAAARAEYDRQRAYLRQEERFGRDIEFASPERRDDALANAQMLERVISELRGIHAESKKQTGKLSSGRTVGAD